MKGVLKGLSRVETDELAALLAGSSKAMPLAKAHGFLTAVISAPTMIMPSVWQAQVLGDPGFATLEHARRGLDLLLRFYNQIASDLNEREIAPPIPGGEAMIPPWCEGYLVAVRMDEVWSGDDDATELMFPIIVLGGEFDLVGEEDADGNTILDPEPQLRRCRAALGRNVIELNKYWLAWRRGNESPIVRAAVKTGRNDMCPCGSGRKYKKCCALTVN